MVADKSTMPASCHWPHILCLRVSHAAVAPLAQRLVLHEPVVSRYYSPTTVLLATAIVHCPDQQNLFS